jgi:hypothetical protein
VKERGVANFSLSLAAVLPLLMPLGCSRSRTYENEQEALYAAEAGLEIGKIHLAKVCESRQALAELRNRATSGEVPLPGYEQPTNKVLGQTIRGSVSVRFRAVEEEPTALLVVSTGERSGTKRVVQARISCSQAAEAAPR